MSGVRPFRDADLPALAGLEAALFQAQAWDAQTLQELASTPGRRLLVASPAACPPGAAHPDPVGYALSGCQGDFAELLRIGVAPEGQRSGVAGRLLEAALTAGRRDGADRMLLEVSDANVAALALYRRHGFVEIDRRPRYYRDGTDALVLQRQLAAPETDLAGSGKMEP